ncbi:MAG: divergent PAP2 family protein [Lachnospirales bacterium]
MAEFFGYNKVLSVAILSWTVAQIIKIIIELIRNGKLDLELMMSSGGMPSSHSSTITACAAAIGFQNGFNSDIFALATIVSFIVMYDASGVRRQAGLHAKLLNSIVKKFEDHNFNVTDDLKELLGHTPVQVISGALLGILIACLVYN